MGPEEVRRRTDTNPNGNRSGRRKVLSLAPARSLLTETISGCNQQYGVLFLAQPHIQRHVCLFRLSDNFHVRVSERWWWPHNAPMTKVKRCGRKHHHGSKTTVMIVSFGSVLCTQKAHRLRGFGNRALARAYPSDSHRSEVCTVHSRAGHHTLSVCQRQVPHTLLMIRVVLPAYGRCRNQAPRGKFATATEFGCELIANGEVSGSVGRQAEFAQPRTGSFSASCARHKVGSLEVATRRWVAESRESGEGGREISVAAMSYCTHTARWRVRRRRRRRRRSSGHQPHDNEQHQTLNIVRTSQWYAHTTSGKTKRLLLVMTRVVSLKCNRSTAQSIR